MDQKKTASLSDVDITGVSLKELIKFIEELKAEFPAAIRVLTKRLYTDQYGQKPAGTFYDEFHDDEKIIESLQHLEGDIEHQVTGTLILSLHSKFGFGKIRVLRLWGQAKEMYGSKQMTADELAKWCELHGIDYDNTFGIRAFTNSKKRCAHGVGVECPECDSNIEKAISEIMGPIKEAAITNE